MSLQKLPEVELHLHPGCGLNYEVVSTIDSTVTKEIYLKEYVAPAKCSDLANFITRAVTGFAPVQTKAQLQLVVHDLFKQLAANNTRYAELRVTPLQHTPKDLTANEVVLATEQAIAAAIQQTGLGARLILCTLRHFTEAQGMERVRLVEQFKGTAVAGLDIAADEAGFPVTKHISAFRYAKEKRIFCTAHAGEAKGSGSVWESLEHFGPIQSATVYVAYKTQNW